MKSWIKKCGGVVFASLLTFMLSGKAYAAAETSDAEIPAEAFEPVAAAVDGVTASDVPNPTNESSPKNDADGEENANDASALSVSFATDDTPDTPASDAGQDGDASSDLSSDSFNSDLSDDTADDQGDTNASDNAPASDDFSVLSDIPSTDVIAASNDSAENDDLSESVADDASDSFLPVMDGGSILTVDENDSEDEILPEASGSSAAFSVNEDTNSSFTSRRMVLSTAKAGESENDGDAAVQTDTILVIGGEVIDIENGASAEDGKWSYSAEYDSVILKNYDGSEQLIGTANKDLTITATGVNRIGTLVVDGDLNIIGSGILLIDSIEMAEGTNFELQTNTDIYPDKTGSVAVFLKQQDGTYLLINGDPNDSDNPGIAAILDGDCTIPDGVTLVLPAHSQMILQSVSVSKDGDQYSTTEILGGEDEGSIWDSDNKATSPKLTVPKSSKIVVSSGALLEFHKIEGYQYITNWDSMLPERIRVYSSYTPSVVVEGALELNCDEVSNAVLTFGQNSSFSGSATISNSTVRITNDMTDPVSAMNIKNSTLILDGDNADIESIHTSGTDNVLIFKGDCEIGSISMEAGSKLTCRDSGRFGGDKTLTVSGSLKAEDITISLPSTPLPGGIDFGDQTITFHGSATVVLQSGIYQMYDTDPHVTITSSWDLAEMTASAYHIETPTIGAAALFDYTEGVHTLDECGPEGSLTSATIPVICGTVYSLKQDYESVISVFKEAPEVRMIIRMNGASISKDILDQNMDFYSWAIVETVDENGHYDLVMLHDDKSIPMNTIKRIYLVDIDDGSHAQGGGGVATSTHTNYTGTGILGGQGAGSIQGGSGSTVFSGSGISNPITSGNSSDDNGNGDNGNGNGDNGNGNGDNGNGNGDNGNGNGDNGNGNGDNGNGNDIDPSNNNGSEDNEGDADNKNAGSFSEDEQSSDFWVEKTSTGYVLCAKDGENTLRNLGGHAKIRMSYTPPAGTNGKSLFAVFRGTDGKLRAFKASVSVLKGELSFTTDCLGEFIIVSFEFDGQELSEAFYEELEILVNGMI